MKLILLGAPGAGKGTQAEFISEKLSIPIIGTGNLIRETIKSGSELGTELKGFVESGQLVPDDIVIKMLSERIKQDDCAEGFILDGFPRTLPQAKALDKIGIVIDKVIDIDVAPETIERRLGGRRVCDKCGSTFHVEYKPSKSGDDCDKCDGSLIIRKDDEPDTVRRRLEVYFEQTEPLKEYYLAAGKLSVVKGQEEVADTTKRTLAVLEA